MKVTASISLELTKKFIKTARKKLLAKYGTDDPIEKLFQKYGYGRSKQKYRIILKTDGSPDVSRSIVVPRDILDFLQAASEQWTATKGVRVQLAFENYITGQIYNKLDPLTPLDKRGPVYFSKLLTLNKRIIGNEKYEELRTLYDSDKQRAPSVRQKLGKKYIVVISRHPYDILGYSSGRDWTSQSCLSIDGCNFTSYMPMELQKSLVAFMVPAEDFVMTKLDKLGLRSERQTTETPDTQLHFTQVGMYSRAQTTRYGKAFDVLSRPIARIAIKPYYDRNGNMILYPGREYGNSSQEFINRLARFVWMHNRNQPMGNYVLADGLYVDKDQPGHTWFSPDLSKLQDHQIESVLGSKLVTPKMLLQTWSNLDHTNPSDRSIALHILRNPLLPRAIFSEAYQNEDKEYLAELAVYQTELLSPQFSKYLIKRYNLVETLILKGSTASTTSILVGYSEEALEQMLVNSSQPHKLITRIGEIGGSLPREFIAKLENIVDRNPIEKFFTPETIINAGTRFLKNTFAGALVKSYSTSSLDKITYDIEGFKEFLETVPAEFKAAINIGAIKQLYPDTFYGHLASLVQQGALRGIHTNYIDANDVLQILDYMIENGITYDANSLTLLLDSLFPSRPNLSSAQIQFVTKSKRLDFKFVVKYHEVAKSITVDQIFPYAEDASIYASDMHHKLYSVVSHNRSVYGESPALTEYMYKLVVRYINENTGLSSIAEAIAEFSENRPIVLADVPRIAQRGLHDLAKYNTSLLMSEDEYRFWYEKEPEPDAKFPLLIRGTELVDPSDDSLLFETYFAKCANLFEQKQLTRANLHTLVTKFRHGAATNDNTLPKYSDLWVRIFETADKLGYENLCRQIYAHSAPVLPQYASKIDIELSTYDKINVLHLLYTDHVPEKFSVPPTVTETQARQVWPKIGVGEFPGYMGTVLLAHAPEFKLPDSVLKNNASLLSLFSCVYEYDTDITEPRYLVGPLTPKTIHALSQYTDRLILPKGTKDAISVVFDKTVLRKEAIDRIVLDCPAFMLLDWKGPDQETVLEWLFSESTVAKAILYGHKELDDDLFNNENISKAIVDARNYFVDRLYGFVGGQFFNSIYPHIMQTFVMKLVSVSAKLHSSIKMYQVKYNSISEDEVYSILRMYSSKGIQSYYSATIRTIDTNDNVSIDSLMFLINNSIASDDAQEVAKYLLNYAFRVDIDYKDELKAYDLDFWQDVLGTYNGREFWEILDPQEPDEEDEVEDDEDNDEPPDEDDVVW